MELPIKTHHIICEQITLEEKNRLNFEKIETDLLLQERIQRRKITITNMTKRLHFYKRILNRISNTELGRIAILFVDPLYNSVISSARENFFSKKTQKRE
jgi:hypothetical protein